MKGKPEFAVYKGDDLLALGTAEECAAKLGVTPRYIYWLTTPVNIRRIEKSKNPEKCTVAIRLDDDGEEE